MLSEQSIKELIYQSLSALSYMEEHKVAHRDLKTLNMFLSDDYETVKLADFGASVYLGKSKDKNPMITQIGTFALYSPEKLKGMRYGPKDDVWSFGVMMYTLLVKKMPFG